MVLMTIGEVPAPETNSEFAFVILSWDRQTDRQTDE